MRMDSYEAIDDEDNGVAKRVFCPDHEKEAQNWDPVAYVAQLKRQLQKHQGPSATSSGSSSKRSQKSRGGNKSHGDSSHKRRRACSVCGSTDK